MVLELSMRSAEVQLKCSVKPPPPPPPPHLPPVLVHAQVDMKLLQSIGGHEKLLAHATGIFKKLGALRAL
jgi:hypothetical protein